MKSKDSRYLLGVDIGSGSVKSVVVCEDGSQVASQSKELTTYYPFPGWSEQNPEDWYLAFCENFQSILSQIEIDRSKIASVCIDSTPHTAVLLDGNNEILRPAILWTDQRSKKEVDWLNDHYGDQILKIAYHKVSPTWTLPQLLWIKRNEPEIIEKTKKVMIAKDYVRLKLTDNWKTDWIDAMGTLMFNAEKCQWSEEICGCIGWPMETLPEIVSPKSVVGQVTKLAASESGLLEGTPVVAGSTDTAVEAFGSGAIYPGQGIVKLATAGNTNVVGEAPHPNPLLFNYYHIVPGRWYTLTGTNSCASAHRWLRDQFFRLEIEKSGAEGNDTFNLMDKIAGEVPAGSDGLIFHPYLLGERTPYYDPYLRADFIGMTMRHRPAHFIRSLYEGIAFSIKDCHQALLSEGLSLDEVRLIGGGSKSPLWRQIISDVLGLEVLKPAISDAAYGAALLGGVGVGIYDDEKSAVEKCVKIIGSEKPNQKIHEKYLNLFDIYKESQSRLVEINHRLREFEEV